MNDQTDSQLLRAYAEHRSEPAFAELVRRHVDFVHSAALRMVCDSHLAEDVTQGVFLALANNISQFTDRPVLSGWLHRTAQNIAAQTVRTDVRRRAREQEAAAMNELLSAGTDASWEQIAPYLDAALGELSEADRDAVLLRYFERKSAREMAQTLGVSEDAAQKRVSRAVERLRECLAKRGVTVGASGLAVVISANAVQTAPVGLAGTISTAALAKAVVSAGAPMLRHSFASDLKLAGVVALMACIVLWVWPRKTEPTASEVVADAAASASPSATNIPAGNSPLARRLRGNAAAIKAPQRIRLKFVVVDATTGHALEGVQIRAAYFYAGGRGEAHNLVTGDNGEATIPEQNEGGSRPGFNVFASIEGYVPKAVGFGEDAPDEYLLKLEPAAAASGIVVDEQGVSVAGVRLEASRSEDYVDGSPNTDFQTSRVETDADGRWNYHYIPKSYDEVRFNLTREGYAVTRASVKMSGTESQSACLVIKRGIAVVGRVVDVQGAAIIGASVKELHSFGHRKLTAVTDVNGEFALLGLSTNDNSKVHIGIQAQGLAAQSKWIELRELTNVVQIVLANGNIFRGRVVDEGGNPIPKAAVRTDYDFKNQIDRRFEWHTETDADGRFEWDSAPAEVICYWFEADGLEVVRGLPLPADGTEHQIILKSK